MIMVGDYIAMVVGEMKYLSPSFVSNDTAIIVGIFYMKNR